MTHVHACAFTGGPGAPDLTESLTNLGVNLGALAVLVFLLSRDLKDRDKAAQVTEREEALGRLLVRGAGVFEWCLGDASSCGIAKGLTHQERPWLQHNCSGCHHMAQE